MSNGFPLAKSVSVTEEEAEARISPFVCLLRRLGASVRHDVVLNGVCVVFLALGEVTIREAHFVKKKDDDYPSYTLVRKLFCGVFGCAICT